MEQLHVTIDFTIGNPLSNGLDAVTVSVTDFVKHKNHVSDTFDLLPSYPLENYVRFELTKFQQRYGTKEIPQNPPQE